MPFNHRYADVRTKTRWHELLAKIAQLATQQKKLFISYAWYEGDYTTGMNARQHRWLTQLQDDLERCGFRVYLDVSDIHGMMSTMIQSELENSDGALIICTPRFKEISAVVGRNISFELHYILGRSVQLGSAYHMMPLLYEGEFADSVPNSLHAYLVRDFTANDVCAYEAGLLDVMNPLGVVPTLLGIRRGHREYEKLWYVYRAHYLPAPNPEFTGRAGLLQKICSGFGLASGKESRSGGEGESEGESRGAVQAICHWPQAIVGLGGVGKTQIALAFAHTHSAAYDFCRWISSEGGQLSVSMREMAVQLGIDYPGGSDGGLDEIEMLSLLYQRLRPYRWLLIFDDADDETSLRKYLPPASSLCPGQHVLITSRSQVWRQVVSMDVFSVEESVAYIDSQIIESDRVVKEALVVALGNLPLALSQAVAYIRTVGLSVSEYLGLLRSPHPLNAFDEADEERRYPDTVKTTCLRSIDRIRDDTPALLLLQVCAWMAADEIPLFLFENPSLLGSAETVAKALKVLRQVSMVMPSTPGHIRIHGLVQLVLRDGDVTSNGLVSIVPVVCDHECWGMRRQVDIDRTRILIPHCARLIDHVTKLID
jgi:hypothetical protein